MAQLGDPKLTGEQFDELMRRIEAVKALA
jgi:hypothetical protein